MNFVLFIYLIFIFDLHENCDDIDEVHEDDNAVLN